MYFITTKRMLEVCFSAHPNIQYRTFFVPEISQAPCPGIPRGHRPICPAQGHSAVKNREKNKETKGWNPL